jgi:hypothetical protein
MTKHRIYTMSFATVYPLYVAKAERKGRTKAEVDAIIRWLTGYTQLQLDAEPEKKTSLEARGQYIHFERMQAVENAPSVG